MQLEANRLIKFQILLKCILYWVLFMALLFLLGSLSSSFLSKPTSAKIYGLVATIAVWISILIVLKYEKRSSSAYGLVWERKTLLRFFLGLLMGTFIFSVIIFLLVGFSELEIVKNRIPWQPSALLFYMLIIPAAFMEEVAFRSYAFLELNRVFGLRITQLIVAIAFALYHIIQGWGVEIAFLGPGIWAFVFGLAAIWSKGIAVPTGIHVALNMMQHIMGLKGEEGDAIWVIQKSTSSLHSPIATSETMGIISQLLVLVVALLMTEYYIRKLRQE